MDLSQVTAKSLQYFNNEFFTETFGAAMGSLLSSTVANMVRENLKMLILSFRNFRPRLIKYNVKHWILCIPKDKIILS